MIDCAEAAFRGHGLRVVRNKPYAGGFITEHYGEPAFGRHALQIEVNRALYMDERNLLPRPGFEALSRILTAVAETLGHASLDLGPRRIAAE
ncbi:N-formylglutamate amidohydrolase [Methylobacterium aquaticum]|uniref:N-formylglutamate amidohydrolase n=1 Tax=Methylobacterium aquaticum TaxID=270351 RepID=UPI0009E29720